MPTNSLHPEYAANIASWVRARDVLNGEDAVKAAAEVYLPRLGNSTEDDYDSYRLRASFFNAAARTADGYLGLVFRRPPFLTLPPPDSALGRALAAFVNDADMLGTSFSGYARSIVSDVIAVGRAGSLIDWSPEENRAYVTSVSAERIINWRVERVNGRNIPTLIVLQELYATESSDADEFEPRTAEQLRVLKLVDAHEVEGGAANATSSHRNLAYVVEIWRQDATTDGSPGEWRIVNTFVPRRVGRPLPFIPFVFHGPRHSRPAVDKMPLADVIAVNLDHYRLSADYKHGMHYTALPTAWIAGFDDHEAKLRIGSSTAWVSRSPAARAGFLEFNGQGLTTFERALDRDERLLALLGSRLLEPSKKVGETAEAIELRQTGESSVLGCIASSISDSLTQVMRWIYWWHSTAALPDAIGTGELSIQLNTDFSVKGMTPQELQAVVAAWQAGALTRETMVDLFRRGELLPESRRAASEEVSE